MQEVIQIGDITLDNALFVEESFNLKKVKAVSFNTLGGSKIVFESIKRDSANNITLVSKENRWLKEDTIKSILTLADNLNVVVDVKYKSGIIIKARFRLEDEPVIKAEELYEGSKWYRVVIKLAKVENG